MTQHSTIFLLSIAFMHCLKLQNERVEARFSKYCDWGFVWCVLLVWFGVWGWQGADVLE